MPTGTRQAVDQAIPLGYLLHEEDADERIDGLTSDPSCLGEPISSPAVARNVGAADDPNRIVHELFIYPDEATAKDAFAVLVTDFQRCSGYPHAQLLNTDTPALGDEAVDLTIALPRDGAGEHAGQPSTSVAVRVGRAIALFSSSFGDCREPR